MVFNLGVEGYTLPIEITIVAPIFQYGVVGSSNLFGVAVDDLMPIVDGAAETPKILYVEVFFLSEYLHKTIIRYGVVVFVV